MGVAADGWRQLALDSIIQNGRSTSVIFTRYNNGEQQPMDLSRSVLPSTYECYAAPVNKMVKTEGSSVLTSVKLLYIPATDVDGNDIEPQVSDTVELEDTYQVLEVLDNYETESVACAYLLRIGK